MNKMLFLIMLFFTINTINGENNFTKKAFTCSDDTIFYYRPTKQYIDKLTSLSSGVWYQMNYCITYLDKMQSAINNGDSLKNISLPKLDKNIGDMIRSIQHNAKSNKKVSKMVQDINPDWFQKEYNQYIALEKKNFTRSIKPTSFIGRKDSTEFKNLCDSLVYLCDKSYSLDSIYKDPIGTYTMWIYKSSNPQFHNIDIFYCSNFEGMVYRLKSIRSSFDNTLKIWNAYFRGKSIKEELKKQTLSPSKNIKINIENRKEPLNITIIGNDKYWLIRL